jgi:peroxiredoxin
MPIKEGDRAPGFTLDDVDGQAASLGDMRRVCGAVLLIFLRHLG